MPDDEKMLIREILDINKDKPFVQRILAQKKNQSTEAAPNVPAGKNAKGQDMYATHKMSWVSDDRGHHVFPTVYMKGGKLTDDPKGAVREAMTTGNYITFQDPEEADWFSQKYKRAWE